MIPPYPPVITFTEGERRVFRLRERDPATGKPLTVSQWASRYRMVIRGGKRVPWSNDIVPYAAMPMDCWTVPYIQKIILCWAPQTGKTNVGFNCLSYSIDQDPGPAMYVMPDEKVTKRISRRRIIPMFKGTPRLAQYLSPRSDDTSTLSVHFMNGMDLMMAWATSVAELASEEARYTIADETDKYPDSSAKEAGPLSLLDVRTITYRHTKKQLYFSTPSVAPSNIWQLMKNEADVVYAYEVPCPLCGRRQIMDFEHITWPESVHDPRIILRNKLARYSCDGCGMKWDDYMRDQAVRRGRWIPGRITEEDTWEPIDPPNRPIAVAFHLPSWYSRDVSLAVYEVGGEEIRHNIAFFL